MYQPGNRARMNVTGTPGTSTITLNAALTDATLGDSQTFSAAGVQDGQTIRYWVYDGHAWARETALYTNSGTTLSNRVNEESSTGSILSLTSAAIVFLAPSAQDILELNSVMMLNNPMIQL